MDKFFERLDFVKRVRAKEKTRLCKLWNELNPYIQVSQTWLNNKLLKYDEEIRLIKKYGVRV